MDNSDSARPRRRWGRWLLLALVLLLALLILGHAFRGSYEERELAREVAELRMAGEPMLAEDFKKPPMAEADNAAVLLREAGKSVNQNSEVWGRLGQLEALPISAEDTETIATVVAANPKALALLRQARSRKGVDWQIQYAVPLIGTLLPEINEQPPLAEVAAADALLAHRRGDDAEALERVKDLLMHSRAVAAMRAGMVAQLIANGIATKTAELLLEIIPDLKVAGNEQKIRQIINELLDESAVSAGARDAMKLERAIGVELVSFKETVLIGRPPGQAQQQRQVLGALRYVLRPAIQADGRFLLRYSKANQEAMERSANWPAYQQAASVPREMRKSIQEGPVWHMMGKMLTANYEGIVLRQYKSLTMRRLAAAALAVKLYAAEHEGRWPKSLEELVPQYLKEVPADPMAEGGKKIRYMASEGRAKLWSVGEDGKDDGGSEKPVGEEAVGRWMREDVVVEFTRF